MADLSEWLQLMLAEIARKQEELERARAESELRAREQTGGAIRALLKLAPKTARRLKADGQDEEIALELVQFGDRLRVRPGDGVPVDGEVMTV